MFTWSLGWTPSPAREAMTSLAFMFEEVPEPVWKTSIGNCSSCSPAATCSAAAAIALGHVAVELAQLGVHAGGRSLDAPQPVDHRRRNALPRHREVLDGLGRFAALQLLFLDAHRFLLRLAGGFSRSAERRAQARSCFYGLTRVPLLLLPAERHELPRHPDGIVIRHQEAGAREDAQLGVGQQVERLLGARQRVHAVLVGPQQQHRAVHVGVGVEQLALRARSGQCRAKRAQERARLPLPPTSASAWRTRSRAAGLERALRRSPIPGRNASRAACERARSSPGTAAPGRRPTTRGAGPGAPPAGAGGWA